MYGVGADDGGTVGAGDTALSAVGARVPVPAELDCANVSNSTAATYGNMIDQVSLCTPTVRRSQRSRLNLLSVVLDLQTLHQDTRRVLGEPAAALVRLTAMDHS
jgi:hypothetical protein